MGRDITKCHPRLQELAAELKAECTRQGYQIAIGESFRSVAEQDALYAQGRTKPGQIVTNAPGSSYSSMHQWGVAFDFYRNDGTGAYNESGNFFEHVGAIGKSLGLEWGGDWTSPVDRPHFQLPDWGSTPSRLKSKYGNVTSFMKTWGNAGGNIPAPSQDNWVLRLQQELVRQGYNPGKVDGIAGPNTLNGCPTVRKGASGGITRLIQEKLSNVYKIGIGTSGADGIFGKDTEAAVMEFQKQKGLSIDGIVGKKTWRALLDL
ncbi:peptidoglycan-binding protein [Ruminococcus gauvreauii]|uniref:Peptidoglycan-binding protein n=1 Tax=Ruminococcus gauvreauii TaxID=438033 RepID=A0ABY5VFC0_9FIRM|nr:peptidoglycan-binding protein [Ruminococcus gauvreauii]UWP58626.1 peptidoglycan-binding protein [Ruminococcus gauvreauii]